MADENKLVPLADGERILTSAEFTALAEVPPETEWFANIRSPNTRRVYELDLRDFRRFAGIVKLDEFRRVHRAHVIAWRKKMESTRLAPASIRRRLSALSALFDFLCEKNAVAFNRWRSLNLTHHRSKKMTHPLNNHFPFQVAHWQRITPFG